MAIELANDGSFLGREVSDDHAVDQDFGIAANLKQGVVDEEYLGEGRAVGADRIADGDGSINCRGCPVGRFPRENFDNTAVVGHEAYGRRIGGAAESESQCCDKGQ